MFFKSKSGKSNSNSTIIQKHLDDAGVSYLRSISDTRPESVVAIKKRFSPLQHLVKSGSTVVSVGAGQGEELCGIQELFKGSVNIVALDISETALEQAKIRTQRNAFEVSFLHGDATKMPLADNSVDAVILSSVLHEVYSYNPNGFDAFLKCLKEVNRVLKKDGVVFIRDFAAPDENNFVSLRMRTPIAMKFYEWFSEVYRKLPSWDKKASTFNTDAVTLPPIGNGVVRIPFVTAAELLLHFRSFWGDYQKGDICTSDSEWKEADEIYLVQDTLTTLNPSQYIEALHDGLGATFDLVYKKISERDQTNTFLEEHFTLLDDKRKNCIPQTTRKIECIFQKGQTIKKHYAAAVIFDSQGNVLLCKRGSHKRIAPNAWHLPGGAIEEDEDMITAVKRELKEELDLNSVSAKPTRVALNYPSKDSVAQTHCIFVEVSNKPKILNSENSEWRFVSPEEFETYFEPHLVEENLKAVHAARSLMNSIYN